MIEQADNALTIEDVISILEEAAEETTFVDDDDDYLPLNFSDADCEDI